MNALPETTALVELIEARTALLRELVSELRTSRSAYVAMDINAIYRHVAAQSAICERLHELEPSVAGGGTSREQGISAATGDSAARQRLREALADMRSAETQARQFHRTHVVMLEGTRRTIQMMANALVMFSPVYPPPAQPGSTGANRL